MADSSDSSSSSSGSEGSSEEYAPPFPTLPGDVDFRMAEHVNSQGLRLTVYRFAPRGRTPRGVVWLCHGYGGHTQFEWLLPETRGEPHKVWKGSVPEGFVNAGYVVLTLDQQGHGRSEAARGLRGFFEDFDDLPRENLEYLKVAMAEELSAGPLPLFVFGMSMGGGTAVRMSQMAPELFRGMVLYAPMLRLEEVKKKKVALCITNGHLSSVGSILSTLVPTMPVAKPEKNTMFPLVEKEANEDWGCYRGDVRARVGAEFMRICDSFVSGGLESVSVPFVVFHSVKDTMTDPLGSQRLFDTASSSDKTYLKVGLGYDVEVEIWHGLSNEPGNEVIFKRALEWVDERCNLQQ